MPTVLQLTRRLEARPISPEVPGVRLRHFAALEDVDVWLDLRRRSFARQKLGVRDWDPGDFDREFLDKPWWRRDAMWFAEVEQLPLASCTAVGTVTLARRGDASEAKPVVHWLAVLPSYRSRGIGRLLMATLEAAVWDSGGRQIWLETHSQWAEAARLYQAIGYRPAGG